MKNFTKYWITEKVYLNLLKSIFIGFFLTLSTNNIPLLAKNLYLMNDSFDNISQKHNNLSFSSNKLSNIYKLLPETTQIKLKEKNWTDSNTFFIKDDNISNRYSIVFKTNGYGELTHIGLNIFSVELTESSYSQVFEYIEMELLTYFLLPSDEKIKERMNNNNVELKLNGNILNTKDLITSYLTFDKDTHFKLNSNSKHFVATWKLNNANLITMEFPNDYTIITGKQKDEIEKEILRGLKQYKYNSEKVTTNQKTIINEQVNCDSIYVVSGNIYNESPDISSDSYFYACDSTTIVFDTLHYKESFSNLFLNLVPTHINFQIKHKLYGHSEDNYKININDFFDYFSKNYKFFVGWSSDDKEKLNASIFIYNVPFNYVHLLVVETKIDDLANDNGTIDGTLYTFIRKDNVK